MNHKQRRHLLECKGCRHLAWGRPKKKVMWYCCYTRPKKALLALYDCPEEADYEKGGKE